jgi:hypothetical protein
MSRQYNDIAFIKYIHTSLCIYSYNTCDHAEGEWIFMEPKKELKYYTSPLYYIQPKEKFG